jgi:hypothetical protein
MDACDIARTEDRNAWPLKIQPQIDFMKEQCRL